MLQTVCYPLTEALHPVPEFSLSEVEDRIAIGKRSFGRVRFASAVFDLTGEGRGMPTAEAEDILDHLPGEVEALTVIVDAAQAGRVEFGRVVRYPHLPRLRYCVDTTGDYEGYLKSRKQKIRRSLRVSRERCAELNGGELDFRVYRTPGDVAEFLNLAHAVTLKTYQWQCHEVGIRDSVEELAAFREDAADGSFRGYLVCAKGKPIAFLHASGCGSTLTGITLGFDPEFRTCYPGFALLGMVIESAMRERFSRFDFGLGDYSYKGDLSTYVGSVSTVLFLRPSLRHCSFVLLHGNFCLAKRVAGKSIRRVRDFCGGLRRQPQATV